jgi:hypothetical protein
MGRVVSEEGLGQGGDEGDLADDVVCHAASCVAHDERVAGVDAEDVCRVDASVHAGDDEDLVLGTGVNPTWTPVRANSLLRSRSGVMFDM